MSDVAQELAGIKASIRQIERVVSLLLVGRPSRQKQAKMAGVHRTTLYRREKRERLQQLANGRRAY
jgi:transcriptional regulator of acetoin/glycerol metabolism